MAIELSRGTNILLAFGSKEGAFFNSSLHTSLIIVVLIACILLVVYPSEKGELWKKFKAFIYIFGVVFFVTLIHKSTVIKVLQEKDKDDTSLNLINGLNNPSEFQDNIPVLPNSQYTIDDLDNTLSR